MSRPHLRLVAANDRAELKVDEVPSEELELACKALLREARELDAQAEDLSRRVHTLLHAEDAPEASYPLARLAAVMLAVSVRCRYAALNRAGTDSDLSLVHQLADVYGFGIADTTSPVG